MSRNDHRTEPNSNAYRNNFDDIFGKKSDDDFMTNKNKPGYLSERKADDLNYEYRVGK